MFTHAPKTIVASLGLALVLSAPTLGATLNITGDTQDGDVGPGGETDTASTSLTVGPGGTGEDFFRRNAILVFELPAGVTSSTQIIAADLSVYVSDVGSGIAEGNFRSADLYGLGYRSTVAYEADWFYNSGTADSAAGENLSSRHYLVNRFLRGNTTEGASQTVSDKGGEAALLSFIQALYDNGAQAGDYAIFRINNDYNSFGDNSNRFILGAADSATASERPTLTLQVVPEPSTLGLLGLGGLTLIRRRC